MNDKTKTTRPKLVCLDGGANAKASQRVTWFFHTLNSSLDPYEVDECCRENGITMDDMTLESPPDIIPIRFACREIITTFRQLVSIGFHPDRVMARWEHIAAVMLDRNRSPDGERPPLTLGDSLTLVRSMAMVVERQGLKAFGKQWHTIVDPAEWMPRLP